MTIQTQTAILHRWTEVPSERLGPQIERRFITGDRMTVGRFDLKRGATVRTHGHDPEEMFCVIRGAAKLRVNDVEVIVRAGELLQIPGGVPHDVEALEDSEVLDIFSPVRQDWIDRTDTYFPR